MDALPASSQVPFDGDLLTSVGKMPSRMSMADATKTAALCAANFIRGVRKHFGLLGAIERVVPVTGRVTPGFDVEPATAAAEGTS